MCLQTNKQKGSPVITSTYTYILKAETASTKVSTSKYENKFLLIKQVVTLSTAAFTK